MYSDHFKLNDDLIQHLDTVLVSGIDPFIASRYTGFLAVSSVTVLELSMKAIFTDFAVAVNPILANFCALHFKKINGRIAIDQIKGEYLPRFGTSYANKFAQELTALDLQLFPSLRKSIVTDYGNLVTWRNKFAHSGKIPADPTYAEVKGAFSSGKEVMRCLHDVLK